MAKNIPVIKSLLFALFFFSSLGGSRSNLRLSAGYPCAMKIQTFIYHPLVLLVLHDHKDLLAVASVVGKAGMGGKGL